MTSDQVTNNDVCHRCGKPHGGSFINNLPTCQWCIHELQSPLPPIIIDNPKTDKTIKVKYLVEGMEPLEYIGEGKSDWIDLRAADDIQLHKGAHTTIPLGVAIELPKGYEALVVPRSSSFKKWGFLQSNSMGVIDEAYCGDNDHWMLPVYATRDAIIKKNDRICQFRLVEHQPKIKFKTVEHLGNEDRDGFGSTGHE